MTEALPHPSWLISDQPAGMAVAARGGWPVVRGGARAAMRGRAGLRKMPPAGIFRKKRWPGLAGAEVVIGVGLGNQGGDGCGQVGIGDVMIA